MTINYNVHYEVAATFFLIFLTYYLRSQYNLTTARNKSFYKMLILVIFANILDIVTAIAISNVLLVPFIVNMFLNMLYYFDIMLLSFQFLDYSFELTQKGRYYNIIMEMGKVVELVFLVLLILNVFTGILYDFENGEYIHGPAYILVFVFPYLMLILSAVVMIVQIKAIKKMTRLSVVLYYLVSMSGAFIQLVFLPNVLLTSFTLSIGVLIILFALESQDYQQLVRTLEEMKVLNEKTQAAVEVKRRFIDNISTNIRKPLLRIVGIDEELLKKDISEEEINLLKENQLLGINLLGTLDDILEYSEAEVDEIELKEEMYVVKDFIYTCLRNIEELVEKKSLSVEIEIDKSLPQRLYGDRDRITQILRELLVNAATYTDEGSIKVRATWKDYDRRHILLLISVEDTGRGIPKELQKQIFSAFETVESAEEPGEEKHIGLGLAFAKKLVKAMNGDIGVYSNEGEGSLFYVEFPQRIDMEHEV